MIPLLGIAAFVTAYTGVSIYSGYVLVRDHKPRLIQIIKAESPLDEASDMLSEIYEAEDDLSE